MKYNTNNTDVCMHEENIPKKKPCWANKHTCLYKHLKTDIYDREDERRNQDEERKKRKNVIKTTLFWAFKWKKVKKLTTKRFFKIKKLKLIMKFYD